ncbi:MAG: hypothetical protein LBT40_16520, partial [Deltaproteobacteria bacterium]|nr:hypothetical protein [Deltaproteobacteria bacterium]
MKRPEIFTRRDLFGQAWSVCQPALPRSRVRARVPAGSFVSPLARVRSGTFVSPPARVRSGTFVSPPARVRSGTFVSPQSPGPFRDLRLPPE